MHESMENNINILPMDTYICNKSLKKLVGMINIKFRVVLGKKKRDVIGKAI